MEGTNTTETKKRARFSTFGKGILLVAGGASLGFFGCLGGILADPQPFGDGGGGSGSGVVGVIISVGGVAMLFGTGMIIVSMWRGSKKK
jgi:hypothetical protein